jgi:hypothetical protein
MKPRITNPLRHPSKRVRIGVWANLVAALMLFGVAALWLASPTAASADAFGIAPDSEAAVAYAQLTAIFKAIGDIIAPLFALVALLYRQWHLAGMLNLLTLVLIPAVDMVVWGLFAGPGQILMHAPFAVPIAVGAYCLYGQPADASPSPASPSPAST